MSRFELFSKTTLRKTLTRDTGCLKPTDDSGDVWIMLQNDLDSNDGEG